MIDLAAALPRLLPLAIPGSIAAFLPVYLAQIVSVGYEQAPFELDARHHERDAP